MELKQQSTDCYGNCEAVEVYFKRVVFSCLFCGRRKRGQINETLCSLNALKTALLPAIWIHYSSVVFEQHLQAVDTDLVTHQGMLLNVFKHYIFLHFILTQQKFGP
jgi:hypothetical protein